MKKCRAAVLQIEVVDKQTIKIQIITQTR